MIINMAHWKILERLHQRVYQSSTKVHIRKAKSIHSFTCHRTWSVSASINRLFSADKGSVYRFTGVEVISIRLSSTRILREKLRCESVAAESVWSKLVQTLFFILEYGFPGQAEHSYFSAGFRLKIFLWTIMAHDIFVLEFGVSTTSFSDT